MHSILFKYYLIAITRTVLSTRHLVNATVNPFLAIYIAKATIAVAPLASSNASCTSLDLSQAFAALSRTLLSWRARPTWQLPPDVLLPRGATTTPSFLQAARSF